MAVTTFIQAPLTGKDFLRSSHIPFRDGNSFDGLKESYRSPFRTDINSVATLSKRGATPRPTPAMVEHKDLNRIKEYLTEAVESYPCHPRIHHIHTPAWTNLCTNFRMHEDPRQVNFLTTQAEGFQTQFLPKTRPICPVTTIKLNQMEGESRETTYQTLFTPFNVSPNVKAKVKHLGGDPTIKEDRDNPNYESHHNDVFKGYWSKPPQPMEKQFTSSVAMGDPRKILETETSHSLSFSHPGVTRPVNTVDRLKVKLGDYSDNKWTSTMADSFRGAKSASVPVMQTSKTLSSIPRGDTDPGRNKQRMMATTNSFFFSERKHSEPPVRISGANVRTRSNVVLGRANLGGLFYHTAAQYDYPKREIIPARPITHPPGHVLAGQEPGPAMSTFQRDFLPLNSTKQEVSPRHLHQIKFSHITAPYNEQHFSTTHTEAFGPKPFSRNFLGNSSRQHISHVPI